MRQKFYHQPVMADRAIEYLMTNTSGVYVDCTLGGGGHSELILKHLSPEGFLVSLDADQDAVLHATERLKSFTNKKIIWSFFDQLEVHLIQENRLPVQGVLFDLGISSFQIDEAGKGFSFQGDAPLDMRFHQKQSLTAAEVVNQYEAAELERIFREYGEDRYWRSIARKIVEQRRQGAIRTTGQLAGLVRSCVPVLYAAKSLARIFQAIRIEVNNEMERLQQALQMAFDSMSKGGRLVVISYHSLEDRMVKEFFKYKAADCICPPELPACACQKVSEMTVLTRKPETPSRLEVEQNPRSRSAKLRAAEKKVPFRSAYE